MLDVVVSSSASSSSRREYRVRTEAQAIRAEAIRPRLEDLRLENLFVQGAFAFYGTVITILLRDWRQPESEVAVAIRERRPLERSNDLQALAREVLAGIDARQGEDIDEWARRIAEDVADASD